MNFKRKIRDRIIIIAALAFTLLVYTKIKYPFSVHAETEDTNKQKLILIDPGHGGYDGGADGKSGLKEKDLNLNISLKLRDTLEKKGYKVVMTRDIDKALLDNGPRKTTKKAQDIANRCKIKSESNADLFISIHQNHFSQSKYYGAQVWYSNNKQSSSLAHIVQENLKEDLKHDNKRVEKPARNDYRILNCSDVMPSILVECGFLSNYEEENRLKDEDYQQKIADSITRSIISYFQMQQNLNTM